MGKMETDLAMMVNNRTYIDYFDRLKLIATSLFVWENLDKVCGTGASNFLENALFEYGRACFVKDAELGYLILNANPSDTFNIYNLPTKINAWSLGYSKTYNFDDIVYIMNNRNQIPTKNSIELFSYRLYETERTIDVNVSAQKTPMLIEGDVKTITTLKNVYMQYSGNIPFIFGNKNYDLSSRLNALKTDAPYLVDKLELHKHEIWDEALTYLGINNANTDKKERLITDEVNSNNDLIGYYLGCFYRTRKEAEEMINELFLKNSDIKVELKLNKDVLDLLNTTSDDIINMDGGEYGEVYSND